MKIFSLVGRGNVAVHAEINCTFMEAYYSQVARNWWNQTNYLASILVIDSVNEVCSMNEDLYKGGVTRLGTTPDMRDSLAFPFQSMLKC